MKKFRIALFVLLSLAGILSVCSCGGEKEDLQPSVKYEEPELPEEFVFPDGTQSAAPNGQEAASDDSQAPDNMDSAVKIAGDIGEIIDFSLYEDPEVYNETDCIVMYTVKPDYSGQHTFKAEITVGTEKAPVKFPVPREELLSQGFTCQTDSEEGAEGENASVLTLCTPETKEPVGFSIAKQTDEEAQNENPVINGVTLTSVNNFTALGDITGASELTEILKTLGAPDFIGITSTETEKSVYFEYYSSENQCTAIFLMDGTTYELMALKIEQ